MGVAAPLGFFGAWVGSLPLAILGFTLWGFANTLSALVVILCNLVGAGLGPLLVGSISDLLHAARDAHPLAHAIGLLALAGLVSSALFMRARAAAVRSRLAEQPGG